MNFFERQAAARRASFRLMFLFAFAVLVTFLVIGAWHGAQWNFVVFGLFHGVWMVVYSAIERFRPGWFDRVPAGRPLAIAFHLVCVSLVGSLIFREPHLDRLVQHLQKHPFDATTAEWTAVAVLLGLTFAASVPYAVSGVYERWIHPRLQGSPWLLPAQTTGWALVALGLFVFYRVNAVDFVYFQF